MLIRINLLAEEQEAAEARRRDPARRTARVGGFVVFLVLLWILSLQCDVWFDRATLRRLDKETVSIQAACAAVNKRALSLGTAQRKLSALDRWSTNRFLWAPALNGLQKAVVDNVQLTHLRSEQRYVQTSPRDFPGSKIRKRPPTIVEKTSLYLVAKDYSSDQQDYLKLKERLSDSDFFIKSLKRHDGFMLDGFLILPTETHTDPNKTFIAFALSANFPDTRQ